MDNAWSLFNTHSNSHDTTNVGSSNGGGQNGHFSNNSWETWDLGSTRHDSSHIQGRNQPAYPRLDPGSAAAHINQLYEAHHQSHSLYPSGSHYYPPDPHPACLNLGKRHYFEDTTLTNERHVDEKRGRPAMGVGIPMCQVDGCHVALMDAKEYHRRHKVCEMHSKAPRVVVLGVEQRFCQQCSRFHAMSEFDDSKRSCRRRLAGHNERRRKGSYDNAINPNNYSQVLGLMKTRPENIEIDGALKLRVHALSLLSSTNDMWQSSSADLSTRGSAALHELIAEHRASNFSRQTVLGRDWSTNQYNQSKDNTNISSYHSQICAEPHLLDRFNEGPNGHVTLDLMQAQNSAFDLLSMRGKSKEQEEECSELMWSSLRGSHEM